MSEWKEKYLDEVVEVDPEQLGTSTDADYSFFYIDISSISSGHISYPSYPIKFQGSPSRARKILRESDILMSNVRPNLKAFAQFKTKSKYNFIASTGFSILRAKPDVDVDFIFHTLFSIDLEKQFEILVAGTAYPAINSSAVRKLKIQLPSLPKQQHIARILSTADAVIEKTQAAIAKYQAIKQGMLQDVFTRGIDLRTGALRPRYEDAPHLYKESALGWIPREWEDCKMGKYILENLYGPRFNARDYFENGNVKTIRGTDFNKDGEILYSQAPKAQLPIELIKTHKLEDGDIVIVTTADCGLTAVFKKPLFDVDFIPSAYSVKYRFAKNVNPYFIKYFMATDTAMKQVNKFVRQGTLGNLPGSDVLKFEMAYPSLEEQKKIAERLTAINTKLRIEQTYLQKMQALKKGLMEDLLTGKVRVAEDVIRE